MMTSIGEIIALETQIWEALKSGDALMDAKMLSDDFLGVYPTGFSNKHQHCDQLRDGPTVASYELTKTRLVMLGKDQVLLSYIALWRRIKNGMTHELEEMYITSIWQRFGREWKNTFSQDTPASSHFSI